MADNNVPLDIWGNPTRGEAECFACGILYKIEESNAPQDYQATYCSWHCYDSDMNSMIAKIDAATQVARNEAVAATQQKPPTEELQKIGDFMLKVPKPPTNSEGEY